MILTYNLPQATSYVETGAIRIDKYLAGLNISELYSRTLIENLIKDNKITVNGDTIKKNYLLQDNDSIEIELPTPKSSTIEPENIPLDIVYEDEYFAIINKPAGIIVHPSPGNYQGTIVNAALNYFGDNLADRDGIRPGIVHRLDKNTSGLLIIAKDDKTLHLLNRLFAERKIQKSYKAIIIGIPRTTSDTINTNIGRSSRNRTQMRVQTTGKIAITKYSVEQTYSYFSLVDILLVTGRTHQIRVHFNHINCPVFGDETYGNNKLKSLIPLNYYKKVSFYVQKHLKRQALHSYRLAFDHPITNKDISIEIPLPEDMLNCIKWLEDLFL